VYDQSKKLLEGKERTALGFVMTTYRQRLTSSLHAIEESLKRRRDKLRSGFTESIEQVSDSDLETGHSLIEKRCSAESTGFEWTRSEQTVPPESESDSSS